MFPVRDHAIDVCSRTHLRRTLFLLASRQALSVQWAALSEVCRQWKLSSISLVLASFTGYLLTYDALKMEFRKVKLPQDTKGCAVCGENPTITELIDYEQAECDGVHL